MRRSSVLLLGCLCASAFAQQREVLLPEPLFKLTFAPTSHSLLVNGLANSYWTAPKKSPTVIPGGRYRQLFVGPKEQWLAGVGPMGEVRTLELGGFKDREPGVKASFIAFAPGGDRIACFQASDHPDNVIEVLDPATGTSKRLTKYASDILASCPAGFSVSFLSFWGWTRDGIRVDATLEGPEQRTLPYLVDPDLDRATGIAPVGPEPTLPDGSIVAQSGSSLVKARPDARTEVLFTEKDSGGPIHSGPGMGPGFAAAKAKSLLAVYGSDGRHAGVWLVNTLTGKVKRVAYGDWKQDATGQYVVAAISPDGEWLAYRDFANPMKVVLQPIKKF